MFYELQTQDESPISLVDAKNYLRVDFEKDNLVIESIIDAATEWGELYCNSDFRVKSWVGYYSNLCTTNGEAFPFIQLEKSPITDISSVEISSGGVYASTTDYIRKQRSSYDRVMFPNTVTIDDSVAYSFMVEFTSGYATLPSGLKLAVLEHIAFLYENRGDAPSEPNEQIINLYDRYRHIGGYA